MATPIIENIAALVVTRLEAIQTGNGYEFTVAAVDRVKRLAVDWTPKHNSIVVEQGDQEPNEELSYPGSPSMAVAYDVTFSIYGFVRESDRASTVDDIQVNQMDAAIKKALVAGIPGSWHTFGGNSINAMLGAGSHFESQDHKGAKVDLVVTYRVSEADPFTVRP